MTRILAIDTALDAVSACVYDDGADDFFVSETIVMQRGQAEALMPLLDRVVSQTEWGFSGLDRIAVTVGPGSFTGLRVGVAAARAIGLACHVPVVGVSTLAALAAPLILEAQPGLVVPAIDAKHGSLYFAVFGPDGRALVLPRVATLREAVRLLGNGPIRLAGSGAPMLAIEAKSAGLMAEIVGETGTPDIAFVARLGLLADPKGAPPRPLYLKPPDAKPQDQAHIPLAPA
ncbi:MAG: tRNA (adenosine(37)-N6)-threonylcarbamoyltransferase complex dimerization subunit type 1 TsaB [Methylovirgula sp.]|nr:tRNA (adenosine(37)-N6)-threonylcarbamoyltransferase complex dimerization subunit type 1 TsaB [Methylovirgula sp.]